MSITIFPVDGLPEIESGADLPGLIAQQVGSNGLQSGDVVVVAHKVVSKAEGRVYPGADRTTAARAESARILRRSGDMLISETHHGLVCANAGVDASNVTGDRVVLLPLDPDLSARRIRKRLELLTGVSVGVVISDTFGRAWRIGQTNVAIGVAGIEPFIDYRKTFDSQGRELNATRICIADELAGAAEMVMGKALEVPVAIVRGAPIVEGLGAATTIVRPPGEDLFR